ncbi:MAG: cohesin domain-containing protein [bacterium]
MTSPTSLTANLTISANAAVGPRVFSLTNAGPGEASERRTFTINNPTPVLTGLTPASGGRGQTLDVTLIGENFFKDVSTASFGPDIIVGSVTVNSKTEITAKISIPLNVEISSRTVSVTNAGPGGGIANLPDGFNIVNPRPTLTSITPTIGGVNQTLEVELSGTQFMKEISSVDFGEGIKIERVTVVNATQIIAKIFIEGWAPVGPHDVSVINAQSDGGAATISRAFAVSSAPVVHFRVPTDRRGAVGDTVKIPLMIDPNGRKVGSFDAKLSFDSQVLAYVDFTRGPILSRDWNINVNSSSGAAKIGAYMQDTTLTQAGEAIILRFRVENTAMRGTTVQLVLSHLSATNSSAGALPVDGADGLFTIPNEARISGKLFYFSDGKPLAGDTLQLEIADPEIRFAVSDANGHFKFAEIPLGNEVLLMPRRVAGNFPANRITSGDALKAFKGRTGVSDTLTAYERLAADVTGGCQVNSGDALAILKRSTESLKDFRRFGQNDWRFVDADFKITKENWCVAPNRRAYTPIRDDRTEQNFTGIILGDVNGSLGSAPSKSAANGPVVAISAPLFEVGSEQIDFAVEVSQADAAYNSFDLTLNFEASIRVTQVSLGAMLKPEDWEMDWNAGRRGVLRIAGFSKSAGCIKGNGVLVNLQAKLAQTAKEGEALTFGMPFSLFGVNGEETPAQTAPEKLTFIAKLPQQYALEQNYPNPFVSQIAGRASHTIIKYALPEAGEASLRIYDMLGQTVRTLKSGRQNAGIHTVVWLVLKSLFYHLGTIMAFCLGK